MLPFYTHQIHEKIYGFLMFSGGYKKETPVSNGLSNSLTGTEILEADTGGVL